MKELLTRAALLLTVLLGQTLIASAALAQWSVTGPAVPQLAVFDDAMKTLMTNHNITSGQLAITWQGRLVLAHGYSLNPGPADVVTQPDSLFRIASVSKPITSTLINRLIQEGKLSLDQTLGQFVDLSPPPGQVADPRLARITIRNLLEHLAGFDIDVLGFDPVFHDYAIASALDLSLPIGKSDIIRYMNGVALSHDPGTIYVYSNYGYLLLGRVIEKVTGMSYAQYAASVFNAIGIWNMRLGRSELAYRAPGEVAYFSGLTAWTVMDDSRAAVPLPYGGFNIENIDSLGGWIASAVELVRWLSNLDNPSASNAILNQVSLDRMFSLPENYPLPYTLGAYYYAKGWQVRDFGAGRRNTWHSGDFTSTTSYAVRLQNGFDYVVLLNRRDETGATSYVSEVDSAITNAYKQITQWPSNDLFPSLLFPNYEGLWWNFPAGSESGWGINFAHQGDVIFATWFTYDVNGKAWWLTMTANKNPDGSFGGTLYQTNGPAFNAVPFNPATVTTTAVGTGTLTFTSATSGMFVYTVNGVTQTKSIVSQAFGPVPTCVWGAQPDLTKATNYQDLWWAAGGAESGWGVNLTQQGTAIFATWFTYDVNHNPLWYSVTAAQTAPNTFTGTLYLTNGPAFSAVPFDPTKVGRTAVGTATFTFSDGSDGTFAYQVSDGPNIAAQTKAITRQVFRPPGTVCQ